VDRAAHIMSWFSFLADIFRGDKGEYIRCFFCDIHIDIDLNDEIMGVMFVIELTYG